MVPEDKIIIIIQNSLTNWCTAICSECVVWDSVIMVLGAGRGPLVSAAIRASRQAARKIKVYAVEKNPNAVVTYVAWN